MDRFEAARVMGMKPTEVIDLEQTRDGVVVTTHDGIKTLLPELNLDGTWTDITEHVSDPEPEPEPDPTPSGDEVPDGAAKDVLAWVGDDQERALQALVGEQAKDAPRKVLVRDLEKLLG